MAIRVRLFGRVQGVGYRAWAVRTGEELGVDGWVRNLDDGSVELQVQGQGALPQVFLERCKRGPALAKVTFLDVDDVPDEEAGYGFRKRPDGTPGAVS